MYSIQVLLNKYLFIAHWVHITLFEQLLQLSKHFPHRPVSAKKYAIYLQIK